METKNELIHEEMSSKRIEKVTYQSKIFTTKLLKSQNQNDQAEMTWREAGTEDRMQYFWQEVF